MTKKDLIEKVHHEHTHFSRALIEKAVHLFFESMRVSLSRHQRIEIRGFGVFCVRERKAHKAHNPKTGEMLLIEKKAVPFFKAGQSLKEKLKKTVVKKEAKKRISPFFNYFLDRQNLDSGKAKPHL